MKMQRRVLFLTCNILSTLHAVVPAAKGKEDPVEKFFENVDGKIYWRRDDPPKNASLMNVNATCVSMEMVQSPIPGRDWPLHIFLEFKNSSGGIEQYDVGVKKSTGETENTLNMTFLAGGPYTEYTGPEETTDPEEIKRLEKELYEESMKGKLVNRSVQYAIQSTNHSLSLLKKDKSGDEECSCWLLYSAGEEPTKKWEQPEGETCQIEVHTTKKPTECPERKD